MSALGMRYLMRAKSLSIRYIILRIGIFFISRILGVTMVTYKKKGYLISTLLFAVTSGLMDEMQKIFKHLCH